MSIRWRKDGTLICGAKCKPEEGDTYIDDRLQYELSVIQQVIVPDENEHQDGRWYWVHGERFIRIWAEAPRVKRKTS